MSSRRQFIFDCSAVLATLAVAPAGSFSQALRPGGACTSLDQMSHALLADQVNTVFRVHVSPRRVVELKLLKAPLAPPTPVKSGHRQPGDAGHEKFSLIFSGPPEELLPSAIHQFEHDDLGRFEMYLGQIGTTGSDGVRYETVFNRPARLARSVHELV